MAEMYTPGRDWTETDLDRFGWHDARIYAMAFATERFEFQLDLDMIVRWISPPESGTESFQFRVAPATLTFQGVGKLEIDLGMYTSGPLTIDSLVGERAEQRGADEQQPIWEWHIASPRGDIAIRSYSARLYFRAVPQFSLSQDLGIVKRGGISFATMPQETEEAGARE